MYYAFDLKTECLIAYHKIYIKPFRKLNSRSYENDKLHKPNTFQMNSSAP